MQVWHVQAWSGEPVPEFTPLNVSEAAVPASDPSILQSMQESEPSVRCPVSSGGDCFVTEAGLACRGSQRRPAQPRLKQQAWRRACCCLAKRHFPVSTHS